MHTLAVQHRHTVTTQSSALLDFIQERPFDSPITDAEKPIAQLFPFVQAGWQVNNKSPIDTKKMK